jgi:dipeptidyl aminopeptidase/acylaminoacyl peptidase
MTRLVSRVVLLSALGVAAPASAQQRPAFDLTIANIMRGPEVFGREPQRVRWSADGRYIYFYWNPPGTKWSDPPYPYRIRATSGATPERLTEAQIDSAGPLFADGSYTRDRRLKVTSYEGDLYLVDIRTSRVTRLTETVTNETAPSMVANGVGVYFVRDNNVYYIEFATGSVRQITDVRTGPAPRDSSYAGQRGTLRSQQTELFDAIRERARGDSMGRALLREHQSRQPKPLYLNAGEQVGQLRITPNGSALLIQTFVPASAARQTEVPSFVTASGYTEPLRVRPKVGDEQSSGRIAFLPIGGEVRWLRLTPGDTIRPPANAFVVDWSDDGSAALVIATSRDYKTRFIHAVDAKGMLTTLDVLRDTAWVRTQQGGWLEGDRAWYLSEADGYSHVYTVRANGSDKQQLTSGKWEVLNVQATPDKRTFYLATSETSPFDEQIWRMATTGGPREKITPQPGLHQATLSLDGQWIANVHSSANRPPELYLMRNRAGAEMAKLTTSPTAEWLAGPWIVPEIVWLVASDGVKVPARIYRPKDMNAQPNGAGVIFVHGAGYLHNVHNFWSSYAREYMFHHLLASRGYVVLDIDYRGSAGYGRDWRTAIYRHMGGRDLQDHVDGSRYLQKEFGISPDRVGIYGGSYGGFITLMALFTEPKHFGAGAGLRSVTDWAHYNHPYTAQILNTPDKDSLAFRRSSPIYFAQGLEDPLLIAHGMVDVNVHFQDVVRLAQRLIELGKENWEMAVYPVEDHGFVRPDSWTDEYTRIYKLFERYLGSARETKTSSGSGRQ